jgi:hypothetical protein
MISSLISSNISYFTKLLNFRPAPITTIALSIVQTLLAKFLFLQERGDVLGIENR